MQTATVTEVHSRPAGHADVGPASLDELLALDSEALRRLYEAASVPELSALRGDLRGRMLAWAIVPSVVNRAFRALASTSFFPWRGKSFQPDASGTSGEGINRVFTDAIKLYRFRTAIGPSRAGSFDAFQLDYDLPENPFFIRAIKDEVRQLRPGLYLGQAYLQSRGKTSLVLYFGLTSL